MTSVALYPGAADKIVTGGVAVTAVFANTQGAVLTNPASATDQGIAVAEPLYYSLYGSATLLPGAGNVALQPGESYFVPSGLANALSVNAATSGHKFSVVIFQPATTRPPAPQAGTFPPNAITTRAKTIPSYLYAQYNDDDDLQAFVSSYNTLAQDYVDTLNDLNLPIYTNSNINGPLLDWVGQGLYGYPRPSISTGFENVIGPLNTYKLNSMLLNASKTLINEATIISTDDIYKRSITWHFMKGDGKAFTVRWLKRRIMRWLTGVNGVALNPDQTYQISVSFGLSNEVTITLIQSQTTLGRSALLNTFMLNTTAPNSGSVIVTPISPLFLAQLFKEAVKSGILELPFQYSYVVVT